MCWFTFNDYFVNLQMISKALHTGWSRGRLPPDSGEVQRRPLNPWRLLVGGWIWEYQWDEVQHQVSETLTQSENPQNETKQPVLAQGQGPGWNQQRTLRQGLDRWVVV